VRIGLRCLAALVALACAPAAANADVVPGRVVVAFAPGAPAAARSDARAAVDGAIRDTVAPRTQVLDVPDGTVTRSVDELNANPDVVWAAPDHVVHAEATVPDDPSFPSQWAWHNTGQYAGTPGVDIEAEQAWDLSTGAGALVAIVDTGVTTGNADFAGATKLWTNPHPGDGGCVSASVSDVHGCDLVNGDGTADDDNGHGTAVASEAAANFDDGVGMAGVAPGAQIMPVKVLGASGSGSASTVAAGMSYAADHGAKIVNVSIGGPEDLSEYQAIATHPDTLFVVAAGNSTEDDDDPAQATYPCAEPLANVLCVGASTNTDARASFSNYGATTVDLFAPGQTIQGASSTNGPIGTWSGTSMASPVTAGVAALLAAHDPSAVAAQIRQAIISSAVPGAAFAGYSVSGGRLDAYRALLALDGTAPPPSNTAAPAVTGTADTAHALTATPGAWTGATSTSVQWQRCATSSARSCQDVAGAVGLSYEPASADAGWYLRVIETAANTTGTTAAASPVVGPVRLAVPAPAPAPPVVDPAPVTPPAARVRPQPVANVLPGVVAPGSVPAARGVARLTLSCPTACKASVRLLEGRLTVATGRATGPAGARPTVTLTLSRAARRVLARRGRLALVAQITAGGVTRRVSIVLRASASAARDAASKPRRRPAA
jgi:thermitase